MKKLLFTLSAAVAVMGFMSCNKSSSSEGSETEGNWIKKADFGNVARAYGVSFTINDIAYVGTGYNGNTVNTMDLRDFLAYDASTNTWAQKASLPDGAGRRYAVAFSVNGYGYVGLGFNWEKNKNNNASAGLLNDFYRYDPSSDSWTAVTSFPGAPRKQAVAFVLNNKAYVGTGIDSSSNIYSDFWEYNPSSDSWSNIGYMPGSKRYGAVAFTHDNKAYVVTGRNSSGWPTDFYSFDGSTWTQLAAITNALSDESFDDDYSDIRRQDAVAFVIGNYAYLTTGSYGSSLSKTWAYKFSTDRWGRRTPYKQSARAGAVGFAIGNYGYVTTGGVPSSSTSFYDNLSQFDPSNSYVENDDIN